MTIAAESAPQVNRALIAMIVIVATIGGFMFGLAPASPSARS